MTTSFLWDSSHYDYSRGGMDFNAAKKDGIMAVTAKLSEGVSMIDSTFATSMSRAVAAGFFFMGGYHVVRTAGTPQQEAQYAYDAANRLFPAWVDHPGFFLQSDVEKWQYDAVLASEGENVSDALEQKFQRKCLLYGSKGQYANSFAGTSHPLWNANYGANAAGPYKAIYAARGGDAGAGWSVYSGKMPDIWQYGSKCRIGSQNTCDANAFRGDEAAFARLLGIKVPNQKKKGKSMFFGSPTGTGGDGDKVYLCDGMTSRYIPGPVILEQIRALAVEGWIELENGGAIREGWTEAVFGPLVGTVDVALTPADITSIANATSEAIKFPRYAPQEG